VKNLKLDNPDTYIFPFFRKASALTEEKFDSCKTKWFIRQNNCISPKKKIKTTIFLKTIFIGFLFTIILPMTMYAAPAKPVISRQPAGATYSENATARFYVNAYSIDGGYLTYQWYRSQSFNAPQSDVNLIKPGATALPEGLAATLTTTTPAVSGTEYYYYWVEITNTKDGESTVEESVVAQAKIVDRSLQSQLMNGDFETGSYSRSFSSWEAVPVDVSQNWLPYWNSTENTLRNDDDTGIGNSGWDYHGKAIELHKSSMLSLNWVGHGEVSAELCDSRKSSIYQDIATVPGKIYEWHLEHATRNQSNGLSSGDIMAVVIGATINEMSDYNSFTTSRWKGDVTFTRNNGTSTYQMTYEWSYPYGFNSASYFRDIVAQIGNDNDIIAMIGQSTTVNYNGNVYYVYIGHDPKDANWTFHRGVYTVPVGQGTTFFAFVNIRSYGSAYGNDLDNIVFASGSPLTLTPTITYGNDVSISVPTKVGYTYGIAEVRGSSVSLVADATAYYDPDGTGASSEVAISKTTGLGIDGWYSTYGSNTPFTAAGVITFKNLVPGKTYRIVGIPVLAVNTGLNVNETPEYVLDEGYYKDIQTAPAYEGSSTVIWNVDVDTYIDTDGVTERARVIVKNARNDVEYALLADNGSCNSPITSDPAHLRTDWIAGDAGLATFDSLKLNTCYYLVARPYGYDEITYADAAYNVDGITPAYIKIKTPGTVTDIDKNNVSRENDCTTVKLANSKTGYTYAVVDPETGVIIGNTQNGNNGSTLTFTVPDAFKTYQIVTKGGDVDWLRGVRIYACIDDNFVIDYINELVKSSQDASGNIPTTIEYSIRSNDPGNTWILGDANTWTAGIGTQPVNLSTKILAGNTRSILDSITSLNADATLYYRFNANQENYSGQWINPVKEIVIPKRPDPPVDPLNYDFNYFDEEITVVSNSLQFAQINASQWTDILKNAAWTFADAGWGEGASERPFNVRIPATNTSFASTVRTDTIPVRPPAPDVGIKSNDDISKIVITNMITGTNYQYYTDLNPGWTASVPNAKNESDSIPFAPNVNCYVRLSATAGAPSSFITVLSSPIAIQPVHFASYAYGDTPVQANVVVINSISTSVDIVSIELVGTNTNSQHYHFVSIPVNSVDKQVPANGSNTNWALIPNNGLDAGDYKTQLKMTYTYNGTEYDAYADVYLTVDKTQWNMSSITGIFDVSQTKAQQLVLDISNAPVGARLSYFYGLTPVPGNPESTVDTYGETTNTFTAVNGLQPSTTYPVSVLAQEDANHYASAITPLANGYTAYATPVFDQVVAIDYINERLTFKSGYSSGDYTLGCSSCPGAPTVASPYSLYNILEDVNNSSIEFSIIHNAGISPPYPASEAGYSATIAGRPAAPPVDYNTVTPASGAASYDGKISITGAFEYRIHGTSTWSTASNSVTDLGIGDYDVRYSADNTTFASRRVMVTVSTILTQPVSITLVECCINDTLSVEIPPTANTVDYQWYINTSNSTGNGSPVIGATNSRFPIPTELAAGTYYYYCEINIAGSSSLVSAVATVTVTVTTKHIKSVYPSVTCLGGNIFLDFFGTSPHEVFYTFNDGSSVNKYSFVVTGSDTVIVANTLGDYTFKSMLDGYICPCTSVFTVQVNTKVNSGMAGADQTICYNSTPEELTSTAATGGSSGNYTYQWIESLDDGATWKNIPHANSNKYQPSALRSTTLYRLVTSDTDGGSVCNIDTGNIVTITVRSISLSNYRDIRLSVCPDAGSSLNLSRYIDSLEVKSIQWTSLSGIPISPQEGLISPHNLFAPKVYSFTYTVSNICVSDVKRKVYLEVLKNRMVRNTKDTVVICYQQAEAVNINRLFGIEADNEWEYYSETPHDIDAYVQQSTTATYGGAVVMNGKGIYELGSLTTYHGVAAKIVKFTCKTHVNSCLHGREYNMVIVLTENIIN
jgi:hypothetical protein